MCETCNEVEIVDSNNRKYCPECKYELEKFYCRERSKRTYIANSKKQIKNMDENFKRLNPSRENLLPNNFNKISAISVRRYTKALGDLNWLEVLERYGKCDSLKVFIMDSFEEFHNTTGKFGAREFSKWLGTSEAILKRVDFVSLRDKKGFLFEVSIEMLDEDFKNTVNTYGRIPPTSELYFSVAKHDRETYKNLMKITGKNLYKQIIAFFLGQEGSLKFNESVKLHKKQEKAIKMEESRTRLKNILITTVDSFLKENGKLPNMKTFEGISGVRASSFMYSHGTYSYYKLLEMYGYDAVAPTSKFEEEVVSGIEKILKYKAIPQKTFDWLKSVRDAHLRCDGFFDSYKLVIEADGQQHSKSIPYFGGDEAFDRIVENDAIKNDLIPKHNLTLIRIAHNEPYYDENFLRMRLYEHSIIPPNHTLISDSLSTELKVS